MERGIIEPERAALRRTPFSQVHIDLAFSTKDRRNFIPNEWRPGHDNRVAGHAHEIANEIQKPHPCKARKSGHSALPEVISSLLFSKRTEMSSWSDDPKKVLSDDVANPGPPEVLYKYLPPDRISLLENMEVYFSRPSQFNDTFDTHYLVPTSKGLGAKAYRLLLRNRVGILCLTERSNDHLMWVHYAQNHTGFVLGFDARAPFFRENARVLRRVVYQRGPRVFAEADLNVCFYKSDVWKHEREWRCVRDFNSSESRVVAIGPSLITHVIIGAKMEDWQVARIVLWATAHEMIGHTKFLTSTPVNNSWTFENKPRTMLTCKHCGGAGYLIDTPEQ